MIIEMKILEHAKGLYPEDEGTPKFTEGNAGVDLRSTEDITIYPGDTFKIKTGLKIHIGSGDSGTNLFGMVVPRSGLGSRGLILANTIGIIDAQFQGELLINAWNRSNTCEYFGAPIQIKKGDRVAQLIIVPCMAPTFKLVEEFSNTTERGSHGFGSSGVK